MHKILRAVCLCTFLYWAAPTQAQSLNYTNWWYFANSAGLDFNGVGPTPTAGGQVTTIEGVSSAADSLTGQLLFYTNGITVWNRNHAVMTNGTGLMGHASAVQSALVVPDPANNGEYYIFTVSTTANSGMRWSKVDMSLSGGLGAVTTKNVLLFQPTTERQCAVKHSNGTDVWVMGMETGIGRFHAFRVTPTGIQTGPVSTLGPASANSIGQMKFSPNGMYCAWVDHGNGSAHLMDFDAGTGALSNYLALASGYSKAAGVSFSPDNSRLYATMGPNYKEVYQWNLCAGSGPSIVGSIFLVGTYSGGWGGMLQIGADGKIYYVHYQSSFLGVINNPNGLGASCNYNQNGLSLAPMTCALGSPNFVESVFLEAPGGAFTACVILSAEIFDFAAELNPAGGADLHWKATEDPTFDYYEIQRSANARNYENIGRQDARGQTGAPAQYYAQDPTPVQGTNYYRLKLLDLDGSVSFSSVVELSIDRGTNDWEAFPQPAGGDFALHRDFGEAGLLRLVNGLGQPVWQRPVGEGILHVEVPRLGMAAGVYALQFLGRTQRQVRTVILK